MELNKRKRKRITLSDRSFAFVIDLALTLILFLVVDLIGYPLANKIFDYESQSEQYYQYQIDYKLGYFDENNEFVYDEGNENFSADMEAFSEDEDVVALTSKIEKEQLCQYGFDLLIAELIVFLVLPLILKKGQTLGLKIMSKQVVSKDDEVAKSSIMVKRYVYGFFAIESLLPFIACILFDKGIIIALVIWIGSIVYQGFNKEHKSIIDLVSNSKVIDKHKKEE